MRTKLKKLTSVCLAVIMILSVLTVAPFTAGAAENNSESVGDTYISGDFEYKVLDDGTASITRYNGNATELEIPSTLDGYNLKYIGGYAFSGCTSLTSVTIPGGVTSIGNFAFYYCTSLASITIPDSVTSIGSGAFENCTSLVSITIPDSVTSIDSYAFGGCTSLTTITIPDSVTSIGYSAFGGCTSLANITIPDSVTSIGNNAFGDTAWYNNLPDGVVYVGKIAYKYKGEMPDNTTIELKEDTVSISGNAFFMCENLAGIKSIGVRAFFMCDGIRNLSFPQSLTNIDWCAFNSCNGLEEVILPSNIKTLGFGAFAECKNLKKAIIPGTLEVIEEGVFYNCENLDEVIISEGVKTIKEPIRAQGYADRSAANGAFMGCPNLKEITIPKSMISIGESAFDKVIIYGYTGSTAETYAVENGFDFVPISEQIDDKSQITVISGTNAELNVSEITDIEELEKVNIKLENEVVERLYDISFIKDGTTVQPNGTVTVKIPCTNKNSKVYRVETDGTLTDMNAVYDNGFMVFTTNHFSCYVLTTENNNTLLGDVDGDGKLSIDDVTDIQKYIANTVNFTAKQEALADVDKDGNVGIDDVTLIQKNIAGLSVI